MDIIIGSTLAWAWPIILAAIALPLISIINGLAGWSTNKKRATVVGVSLVLAVLYVIAAGLISEVPQSWSDAVTRILVITAIVVVVTQAVYGFLKPGLTALESKVSGNTDVKGEVIPSEQEAQARPADG